LNGRRNIRTGTFISSKADYRAQPWESYRGELAVLYLAEGATGVGGLLAQPHRLEILTNELNRPLLYFPDLKLVGDQEFRTDFVRNVPFATLAARMRTRAVKIDHCRTMIAEVKLPDDPRLHDPYYNLKMTLVAEVYRRLGIPFRIIERDTDFTPAMTAPFRDLFSYDKHTKIFDHDYDVLRKVFDLERKARFYGEVAEALGRGPTGMAKMLVLQMLRRISIDLSKRITPDSKVLFVRQEA